MATILAVNISEKKGTPKKSIPEGILIENFGLEGDAHAGKWHRQISLLAVESIEKAKGMRTDGLCHGVFAENLTTEGITLYTLPVGTLLSVGDESILEVTQIGKECHEGCAIYIHSANLASTPFMNAGEPSCPYFLASSTASLMATPVGTESSYLIS